MKQLQEIEKTGNAAVRKLRINKLKKGHPIILPNIETKKSGR